jgi:hypothetical protein
LKIKNGLITSDKLAAGSHGMIQLSKSLQGPGENAFTPNVKRVFRFKDN